MPVVSDASPLILYASVGRLALLHELFGEIVVPPAVWSEITAGGVGRRGAQEVESAPWIRQQAPLRSPAAHGLPGDLDAGEAEAIALAVEAVEPAVVLMDDRGGRRAATQRGLTVIGSAGILVLAKRRGLVAAVLPVLDQLRASSRPPRLRSQRAAAAGPTGEPTGWGDNFYGQAGNGTTTDRSTRPTRAQKPPVNR